MLHFVLRLVKTVVPIHLDRQGEQLRICRKGISADDHSLDPQQHPVVDPKVIAQILRITFTKTPHRVIVKGWAAVRIYHQCSYLTSWRRPSMMCTMNERGPLRMSWVDIRRGTMWVEEGWLGGLGACSWRKGHKRE